MFGNSRAAKSARVKQQLRDSNGRWIEMGGLVKWTRYTGSGLPVQGTGKVLGFDGDKAEILVGKSSGPREVVKVEGNKLTAIASKATLDKMPLEEGGFVSEEEMERFKAKQRMIVPLTDDDEYEKDKREVEEREAKEEKDKEIAPLAPHMWDMLRREAQIEYNKTTEERAKREGKKFTPLPVKPVSTAVAKPEPKKLSKDEFFDYKVKQASNPKVEILEANVDYSSAINIAEQEVRNNDRKFGGLVFREKRVGVVDRLEIGGPADQVKEFQKLMDEKLKDKVRRWSTITFSADDLSIGSRLVSDNGIVLEKISDQIWEYTSASNRISYNNNSIDAFKSIDAVEFNVETS